MNLRGLFHNWSIKTRLGVLFMLAAFAMSSSSYLLIHRTLHTSLSQEENDFVLDRLHALRAIIKTQPEFLEIIKQDIVWEGKYAKFPEYYLRITDDAAHVLIETPGMDKMFPIGASSKVPDPDGCDDDDIMPANNGRYFLSKTDIIAHPSFGNRKIVVQLALDVTSRITIDEANHKKVIGLLAAGVVLFVGFGLIIISKVLSPLEVMIKVVEEISVNQISRRTDPKHWPKEVRRLAISFNTMLDRLEQSFNRLSNCAANMAHEIRTPINNLMGEAEVALLKQRTPEEYEQVLESSIEECTRLSRVVDNLLFLSHAENPAMCIEHAVFDPAEEIRSVFSRCQAKAEAKGASLTVRGHALLRGDPLLFHRAISNLVMNALLYSDKGVAVEVAIKDNLDRQIEVEVKDTGFGIAEEDVPRIFDRFYRADSSHSNYAEGSGLGLSIVKAIMDLHGGSISLKSSPGKGTTFTLLFPRQPSPASTA